MDLDDGPHQLGLASEIGHLLSTLALESNLSKLDSVASQPIDLFLAPSLRKVTLAYFSRVRAFLQIKLIRGLGQFSPLNKTS